MNNRMVKQTRRKTRLPKDSITMHGVVHWHKSVFEKLGWMVLMKAKGYDYKIKAYKKEIDNLLHKIKHLSSEYTDHNKKHDLNVMRMNVEVLEEWVRATF